MCGYFFILLSNNSMLTNIRPDQPVGTIDVILYSDRPSEWQLLKEEEISPCVKVYTSMQGFWHLSC